MVQVSRSIAGGNPVDQIEATLDVARLTLLRIPERPGIASEVFIPLAEADICVDVIIQSQNRDSSTDLSFTVDRGNYDKALGIVKTVMKRIDGKFVQGQIGLAKVSVSGARISHCPGVAGRIFGSLSKAEVNIMMISTSDVKVSCIIMESDVDRAVETLYNEFA